MQTSPGPQSSELGFAAEPQPCLCPRGLEGAGGQDVCRQDGLGKEPPGRALCGENAFVPVACGVGRVGAAPQAQREGSGKPSSTEQHSPARSWNGFLVWKSLGLVPDPQPCYTQGPKMQEPHSRKGAVR